MRTTLAQLVAFAIGLAFTRGQILRPGSVAHGLVYRGSLYCACFLSYFELKEILPAVSTRAVDASIYAFDLRVFGFEPSVVWDRFVTVQSVEWFAFFYFGYFFLLALHVLPIMLATKDMDVLTHFCLGIFLVFFCGHLIYMMVPGYGPHTFLAGTFQNDLRGGLFWALVEATVKASGAQKGHLPQPAHRGADVLRHLRLVPPRSHAVSRDLAAGGALRLADHHRDDVPPLALPDRHLCRPGPGHVRGRRQPPG